MKTTLPQHFADFITTQTSAGLLIVPKTLTISEVVEDILLIWSIESSQDRINRIRYLPI